jgi:bifunctional non-homologous end joining protein LigD
VDLGQGEESRHYARARETGKSGGQERRSEKNGNENGSKKNFKAPPKFIEPQLTTRVDQPPGGDQWLHEIKFDGYRLNARVENGEARLLTRRGQDWTDKFEPLAAELAALNVRNAYLDGEAVVLGDKGHSDFSALQNWFTTGKGRLVFYLFDILFLDGEDLHGLPLLERKERLRALLGEADAPRLIYSDHQIGNGARFFRAAADMRVEGIISKQANAPYTSGRTHSWLKIKVVERQEFVIGGFVLSTVSDTAIGALLMGEYVDGKFVYVGKVGTGYTNAMAGELFRKLSKLKRATPPFEKVPSDVRRGSVWVDPKFVAEVEFSAWTADRILRHAAFQGLREDKAPKDVKPEKVESVETAVAKTPAKKPVRRASAGKKKEKEVRPEVLGIGISHPEREIFPDKAITKLEVAEYYEAVAAAMLPHVADRPLALVRCPDGVGPACFFQKHAGAGLPEAIRELPQGGGHNDTVLLIDSAEGLVSLVQRGVLEIHCWGSHYKTLEQPDMVVFDFDPDPAVKWPKVVKAAVDMRAFLKDLGLESFLKTTGGKGLHVVVPFKPLMEWDAVKEFTRIVADKFAATDPDMYLINMSKKKREGKIFVDYLRNGRGATAIAPYSTRARPGALIATPISWAELDAGAKPQDFTMERVIARVSKRFKDPWKAMLTTKQSITEKALKKLMAS